MWSCRRRKLPSSWSNTKRRARVRCLQRRRPTKAPPRKVVLAAEGAKASSTGVVAQVHEEAEDLFRTVETSEGVRISPLTFKQIFFLGPMIVIHVLNMCLDAECFMHLIQYSGTLVIYHGHAWHYSGHRLTVYTELCLSAIFAFK